MKYIECWGIYFEKYGILHKNLLVNEDDAKSVATGLSQRKDAGSVVPTRLLVVIDQHSIENIKDLLARQRYVSTSHPTFSDSEGNRTILDGFRIIDLALDSHKKDSL